MVLQVKVNAEVRKVNPAKVDVTSIVEQIRDGVKAWVMFLQKRLPTYTDTLRGTLVPAGRIANVIIPRRPRQDFGRKKYIVYGNQKFPTGFEHGDDHAQAELKVSKGANTVSIAFVYTNTLPYFVYNNNNPAPPGFVLPSNPPWRALEEAELQHKIFQGKLQLSIPKLIASWFGFGLGGKTNVTYVRSM